MIKNLRPVKQQAATVGLHLLTYSQWNCHFGKEEAWLLQLPVDGLPQANHWQVRAAWGIMNMKLCKAIFSASRVVSTTTTTNFIREKQETKQLRNSWMKTTSDRLPDNWPSVLVAIDKQIAYIATPLWVAIAILSLSVCPSVTLVQHVETVQDTSVWFSMHSRVITQVVWPKFTVVALRVHAKRGRQNESRNFDQYAVNLEIVRDRNSVTIENRIRAFNWDGNLTLNYPEQPLCHNEPLRYPKVTSWSKLGEN